MEKEKLSEYSLKIERVENGFILIFIDDELIMRRLLEEKYLSTGVNSNPLNKTQYKIAKKHWE